jgi:hypothetical protein
MVVMRIFLIFIAILLLFNIPLYGLMSSSTEGMDAFGEKESSLEMDKQIEEIRKEKKDLIEEVMPLREERRKTLHPFVHSALSSEAIDTSVQSTAKGFIPFQSKSKIARVDFVSQNFFLKPALNLIFFSIIAAMFLAAYFFIKPKR